MIYGSGPSGRIHRRPQRLASDEQPASKPPLVEPRGKKGKHRIGYAGAVYPSIAAAARAMDVSPDGIWSAIRAGRGAVKGKTFEVLV